MKRPTHDYAASKDCGCVVAICYADDDPATAKLISQWVREGYTIGRLPIADAVRLLQIPCPHEMEAIAGFVPIDHDDPVGDDRRKLAAWNAGAARKG